MATENSHRAFPVVNLCGVNVSRCTEQQFIQHLCDKTLAKKQSLDEPLPGFVTYLNAACSNIAASDSEYRRLLDQADIVYADGQAIVWASHLLGNSLPERVNAGDFIIRFCQEAAAEGLSIGLIGGRAGVAARAAELWKTAVPQLQLSGTWEGFFHGNEDEVVRQISESNTDILLVGMSVPIQEKWAFKHRSYLHAKTIWCVGALFEYYGENRPRAPVWMRKAGLEWLFRLCLEPRRLWRRYLLGNFQFIWRVVRCRGRRK